MEKKYDHGEIRLTNTPVVIEKFEGPYLEPFKSGMNITHPNSLRAYTIKTGKVKYERFDCTMKERVTELHFQGIKPVVKLNNEEFVTNEYKEIMKSMVLLIQNNHEKGYCMNGIIMENVVVVDGKVKFWHYELSEYTNKLARRDYKSLRKLLKKDIFKNERVPYDLQKFFELLKYGELYPYLVRNHVALMSLKKLRSFIRDLWDRKDYLTTNGKFEAFCKKVAAVKILNAQFPSWDRNIPQSTALASIFHHGAKYNVKRNIDILKYLRNCIEHLGGHSNQSTVFNEDQALLQLMVVYPFQKMVVDVQENLALEEYRLDDDYSEQK